MLLPLSYHIKTRDYFKQQEKTWQFFAADKIKEEQLTQFKTEVLKNTYKFDPVADEAIYQKVDFAREKLGLQPIPVTVYQAQYTDEINASISFLNKEAHIVFSGRIIQLLDSTELLAVIAHELTHIKLYTLLNEELEITDRIITAIANNHNSDAAYYETARIFKLYTEIFCDRGAYTVVENTDAVITSLIKIVTGLEKVNAASYLKQAEEIFINDKTTQSVNITHPENFIRARAIQLWHEQKEAAEETIIKMIEGIFNLDQLDIFKQKDLTDLTRRFLQLFLKPKWFQSTMVMAQAQQYFNNFSIDEKILLDEKIMNIINQSNTSIKDYLAYVLLDFVLIDPALEDIPAGWAFQFAEDIQIKEIYDAVIKKEMKLSDKKLQQYKQKALASYYEVKEGQGEQIYE
ncbi:MAG: M48 family metalloprotease [Chitinophagaceae bacterium]|nr:M48 family metalloprotease [Chitinophagaceae bacterium]